VANVQVVGTCSALSDVVDLRTCCRWGGYVGVRRSPLLGRCRRAETLNVLIRRLASGQAHMGVDLHPVDRVGQNTESRSCTVSEGLHHLRLRRRIVDTSAPPLQCHTSVRSARVQHNARAPRVEGAQITYHSSAVYFENGISQSVALIQNPFGDDCSI
jgi:hypothetical protein